MKELMAVEAALFSAGKALDPTEAAEATGLSRNKALGALDALVEIYKTREGALEVVKLGHKYALQLKTEAVEYGRRLAPRRRRDAPAGKTDSKHGLTPRLHALSAPQPPGARCADSSLRFQGPARRGRFAGGPPEGAARAPA